MSASRFYLPAPLVPGSRLDLPDRAAHHAARVLRLRVGDRVVLFNGEGGEHDARILAVGKQSVQVELGEHHAVERESPLAVTLVQALSSGDRMDITIQKAVELGVRRIVPVESERSVVRLKGERSGRRVTHWQEIVVSACEQCGRNRVPAVEAVVPLATWLSTESQARRWVLSPDAASVLRDQPRPDRAIELLVGPEGGFTEDELGAAHRAGFQSLRLGPRVLRTETAAPALLAALQALWGDF